MKLRVKPRKTKRERAHLTREGERQAAQHLREQNLRLLKEAHKRLFKFVTEYTDKQLALKGKMESRIKILEGGQK